MSKPDTTHPKRMLVIHGIYGSGRNWRSVARRLTTERPDWALVLVDMRCHGQSRGFPPPHSVESCARDLLALEEHLGFSADAVLGHSYGGKVALLRARMGRIAPRQVWLIDASPSARQPGGTAWRMLNLLRQRAGPFSSRNDARATVEAEGFSPAVAAWMALNATPEGEAPDDATQARWTWRLNPDEMEALLRDYFRTDAWDVVENPPAGTEVHVVGATVSSVLDAEETSRLQRAAKNGRVSYCQVVGGHWLHADNPQAVVKLLANQLP